MIQVTRGIGLARRGGMAVRDFTDPAGTTWRVWQTTPTTDAVPTAAYERGWLSFESSSGSLRRLTPVPLDWERVSDVQLAMLCRAATEVPRRRTPSPDAPDERPPGP